eukprot:maker-scaffold_14-snap-gene-4.51-mRNA-1 protein AED:0.23 eAED:0.23 QI:45/1/1/1/1/1/2/86/415
MKLPNGSRILGEKGLEENYEREELIPTPAFVIKTYDIQTKRKVFINICQSPLLPRSGEKTRLTKEGKEETGLNVPLSLGPIRETFDKSNNVASVCDIVVNPEILSDLTKKKRKSDRQVFIDLCLNYVEQKFSITIDKRIKYPKLIYKYENSEKKISVQYIRKTKQKINGVEELDVSQLCYCKKQKNILKEQKVCVKNIEGEILWDHEIEEKAVEKYFPEGAKLWCSIVFQPNFYLQKVNEVPVKFKVSSSFVRAETIPCDMCQENVKFADELLRQFLPFEVDPNCCTAKFDKENMNLSLKVSLLYKEKQEELENLSWENVAYFNDKVGGQPDVGSKQWNFNRALKSKGRVKHKRKEKVLHEQLDEKEFPEESFHENDIMSMHYLSEKENSKKEQKLKMEENEKKKREVEDLLKVF